MGLPQSGTVKCVVQWAQPLLGLILARKAQITAVKMDFACGLYRDRLYFKYRDNPCILPISNNFNSFLKIYNYVFLYSSPSKGDKTLYTSLMTRTFT